jgi:hypothetical protein
VTELLQRKVHPFIFGLYRIALAGFLLLYTALLSNRWIEFYGPLGTSPIKLRDELTFVRPSVLSYLHTETGLWIYYGMVVVMLVAMLFGRWGKLPAIFIWLYTISIENSNANNVNAEEFAFCVFTFYAMLMPINSTLVFDFKKRSWSDSQKPVPAWILIPFIIHIELIYIISLPLKPYFDHAWVDGTLIYLAVNTFDMSRIPGWLGIFKWEHAIISRVMTWASLLVELAFPLLVWVPRFRVPVILAMVSFQLGIAVMLSGVQMFGLSMIIALILFLPSEDTHGYFRKGGWKKLLRTRSASS